MTKFQLISDIHLEFLKGNYPDIKPVAPNLILAGDICPIQRRELLEPFLQDVSEKFENIIYVPGNHEYYSGRRFYKEKWDIEYFPENVYFLDNDTVTIDGVKIIGTTLWTNIPEDKMWSIMYRMNDYMNIFIRKHVRLSPQNTVDWHKEALEFLEKEVEPNCVVVTHHAPLDILKDEDEKDWVDSAYYATDVPDMLIALSSVWCYGHTHKAKNIEYLTSNIVSNPMGYNDESNTGYDPEFTFVV